MIEIILLSDISVVFTYLAVFLRENGKNHPPFICAGEVILQL